MNSYTGPAPFGGRPAAAEAAAPADTLKWARQGYCGLVIAAAVLQVVAFSGTEDNLLSTLIAFASSLIGIAYSLNTRRFQLQPISALILLFYTTTSTSGALIIKSIEWSPLADRLSVPLTTFSVLAATQVLLLAADRLYLRLRPLQATRDFISTRVLQRIGVMDWPPDWHLWLLGGLGCVSVLLTGTDYESGASFGLASAGDKVIRAFGFFKFAPFLIPFRNALSGTPTHARAPVVPLAAYFVGLVIISFATNSRSTFADAVPTIGICMLIGSAWGLFSLRHIPKAKLILGAIGALIAIALLSRVALAMVVVRDYRYSVDVGMLVKMTLEALGNDEWLAAAKAKMDSAVNVGNYSETYVDSRFAARFLLTKFHDNILYYFSLFGPDHIGIYKQFMSDRLFATLPDPLLRLFGLSINKEDLVVSNGDYIVYIIDGWGLGGFKTGSMIAEVYAVFGWLFPLVILVNALLLFVFHDAFVGTARSGRKVISPLMLLLIWNLVGTTAAFGLGAETVTAIPAGIVRGLPQNVLMYLIATSLVRGLGRFIGKSEPAR
jgi:hypothetical protein